MQEIKNINVADYQAAPISVLEAAKALAENQEFIDSLNELYKGEDTETREDEEKNEEVLVEEDSGEEIEVEYPEIITDLDYKTYRAEDGTTSKVINSSIDTFRYFLQKDEGLKNIKGYNVLTDNVEVSGPLPWRKDAKPGDAWQDTDDNMLRGYIFNKHKSKDIKINNNLPIAFDIETQLKRFNPLKDYLDSVKWDGVERLDNFLIDWFGAEDCEWSKIAFRRQMIAGVSRALNPGSKVDTVLVLISAKQGVGKSTLCRMLGKDWFNDSITTFTGKEAYEALQGSWVVEIPENSVVSRTDVNQAKAFISKQEDKFRAAYAHRPLVYKRMCIFIITANDKRILKDSTGNRRYLPVDLMVSEPKHNFLREITPEIIDQLWAEALVAYNNGEQWWLTDKESELAEAVQEEHREEDPRKGIIEDYLEIPIPVDWKAYSKKERKEYFFNYPNGIAPGKKLIQRQKVCAEEIAEECLGYDLGKGSSYIIEDIKKIMEENHNWIKQKNAHDYEGYGRKRGWSRDNTPDLPF